MVYQEETTAFENIPTSFYDAEHDALAEQIFHLQLKKGRILRPANAHLGKWALAELRPARWIGQII